jgi:hypothetical protein
MDRAVVNNNAAALRLAYEHLKSAALQKHALAG